MIGITVFSDRMIIFSALKHFLKHSAHDQVIEVVLVTCDDAELSQLKELIHALFVQFDLVSVSSTRCLAHRMD